MHVHVCVNQYAHANTQPTAAVGVAPSHSSPGCGQLATSCGFVPMRHSFLGELLWNDCRALDSSWMRRRYTPQLQPAGSSCQSRASDHTSWVSLEPWLYGHILIPLPLLSCLCYSLNPPACDCSVHDCIGRMFQKSTHCISHNTLYFLQ